MPIYRPLLCSLLIFHSILSAAPLREEEVFFIGSFQRPKVIAGYDRKAYIAGSHGILVYDHQREAWTESIPFDGSIDDMFYSTRANRLRVRSGGSVYEYNETFRDFTLVDSLRESVDDSGTLEEPAYKTLGRLAGYTMPHPWHFFPGGIRDKYMRSAAIRTAVVFDYDRLWVLTAGLGVFRGSERRRRIEPAWVGLEDPEINTLSLHGNKVWMGGHRARSALVSAKPDLQEWQYYIPGDHGFSNGRIHDMAFWKGNVWLATEDGVLRFEDGEEAFVRYGYFQGLRTEQALVLTVHQDKLFAGTDRGLASLQYLADTFEPHPHPNALNFKIYGMASTPQGLWIGGQFGLYCFQNGFWEQPGKSQLVQGLKIRDVAARGDVVYYIDQDGAHEMKYEQSSRERFSRELFRKPGLKELFLHGKYLFGVFERGVRAYNLDNLLNVDFNLNDGIMGLEIHTAIYDGKYLWVATDKGVSRIDALKHLP